jgi:hypothetical protein
MNPVGVMCEADVTNASDGSPNQQRIRVVAINLTGENCRRLKIPPLTIGHPGRNRSRRVSSSPQD